MPNGGLLRAIGEGGEAKSAQFYIQHGSIRLRSERNGVRMKGGLGWEKGTHATPCHSLFVYDIFGISFAPSSIPLRLKRNLGYLRGHAKSRTCWSCLCPNLAPVLCKQTNENIKPAMAKSVLFYRLLQDVNRHTLDSYQNICAPTYRRRGKLVSGFDWRLYYIYINIRKRNVDLAQARPIARTFCLRTDAYIYMCVCVCVCIIYLRKLYQITQPENSARFWLRPSWQLSAEANWVDANQNRAATLRKSVMFRVQRYRLYFPACRQYTNLFIFLLVSEHCTRSTLRWFHYSGRCLWIVHFFVHDWRRRASSFYVISNGIVHTSSFYAQPEKCRRKRMFAQTEIEQSKRNRLADVTFVILRTAEGED